MDRDRQDLIKKYGPPTCKITNEVVIAMSKEGSKLPVLTAAKWLLTWIGDTQSPAQALRKKMQRIVQKASKMRGASLDNFKREEFIIPASPHLPEAGTTATAFPSTMSPTLTSLQSTSSFGSTSSSPPPTISLALASTSLPTPKIQRPKITTTPTKKMNAASHQLRKKEEYITVLDKKIAVLKNNLSLQARKNSHFSLKNVIRREKTNSERRVQLRKEKANYMTKVKRLEDENLQLKEELRKTKKRNNKLSKRILIDRQNIKSLRKQKDIAEKRIKTLRKNVARKSSESLRLEEEEIDTRRKLKKGDGEFTDDTRFCVMELAGLEVATGKIGPVMETVGKLCGVSFSSLPSRPACQQIVDEGHIIAKNYIRENVLKRCGTFGIHKDGTSRKKIKILDTSLSTDTGESFCLGWSSVAAETGEAIADETIEKLGELADASSEGGSMEEMLKKMDFFMNDRAANEKKSSRLLEEWREKILHSHGADVKKINHLFCAAHVLLGFHNYVISAIKKTDMYSCNDQKHHITIMLKDASDLFGPVGDFRGFRDQWEAFCLEKGIKSTIKSFKDNRFNGLFEVAAQVFHHHQDFLLLFESQPTSKVFNAKQMRLRRSLQNKNLILLLECLGMFFHSITGPFWMMVISPKTTHEKFRTVVRQMKESLEKCSDCPSFFFNPDSFCFLDFPTSSAETKKSFNLSSPDEKKYEIISVICKGFLAAINAQLADYLEEGQDFAGIKAPLTNLTCERHFGHLDASQRRRPHSSLHHHSSIILLKQTRKKMREWYDTLDSNKKVALWKKARTESKQLRRKHREHDRKAVIDTLKFKISEEQVPINDELKQGQMIAVACQDAWYPAVVENDCSGDEDVQVSFAELGKGLGMFRWPTGKDVHKVSRKSIVDKDVVFQPQAGGRIWCVLNAKDIQTKFQKFQ